MTQYNLPESKKRNWEAFLPSIDYQSIYWNSDRTFLVSVVVSFIVLYVNLKMRRIKYSSYAEKEI